MILHTYMQQMWYCVHTCNTCDTTCIHPKRKPATDVILHTYTPDIHASCLSHIRVTSLVCLPAQHCAQSSRARTRAISKERSDGRQTNTQVEQVLLHVENSRACSAVALVLLIGAVEPVVLASVVSKGGRVPFARWFMSLIFLSAFSSSCQHARQC